MNYERFNKLMRAVDDELLEEAQKKPKAKNKLKVWMPVAAAACLCLVITAAVFPRSKPAPAEPMSASVGVINPMQQSSMDELSELGYAIPLPSDARELSCTLINRGEGAEKLAQVKFVLDGEEYCCRTLRSTGAEDISGLHYEWSKSLDWNAGQLEMQLRSGGEDSSWVGWYSPEDETQWCLSGSGDTALLMNTARYIVETLGYNLTVAPPDAENVIYSVHELGDLIVGQTEFSLNGQKYFFRMASTDRLEDDFADISGIDGQFAFSKDVSVAWCSARLSYDEGGCGKIVWFDIVPGILYSLSTDSGADENSLMAMAISLFEPVQADS